MVIRRVTVRRYIIAFAASGSSTVQAFHVPHFCPWQRSPPQMREKNSFFLPEMSPLGCDPDDPRTLDDSTGAGTPPAGAAEEKRGEERDSSQQQQEPDRPTTAS